MLDRVIINGLCNSDIDGEFTYVSPYSSSVIDNFIVPESLFPSHCELHVVDSVDSWHLPVEFKCNLVGRVPEKPAQVETYENCIV